MARERTIKVAALNVRVHPHPEGVYRRLLRAAYQLTRPLKIRGDTAFLLSSLDESRYESEGIISGALARFTELDVEQPWFNLESLDIADDKLVSTVNIPSQLRPNFKAFFFQFIEQNHLLVFETYGHGGILSTNLAHKFFTELFNALEITKIFGRVKIDLLSDTAHLDRIIENKKLLSLQVIIRRPNDDGLGGIDALFEAGLLEQRAREIELYMKHEPGQYLKLNKQAKRIAQLGAEVGDVNATVEEDGRATPKSTSKFPQEHAVRYDPEVTGDADAFRKAVRNFYPKAASQRGG